MPQVIVLDRLRAVLPSIVHAIQSRARPVILVDNGPPLASAPTYDHEMLSALAPIDFAISEHPDDGEPLVVPPQVFESEAPTNRHERRRAAALERRDRRRRAR